MRRGVGWGYLKGSGNILILVVHDLQTMVSHAEAFSVIEVHQDDLGHISQLLGHRRGRTWQKP